MMGSENGGPAYPTVDVNRAEDYGTHGMSLRDYFAAQAPHGAFVSGRAPHDPEKMAASAYKWADAMLAERAKSQSGENHG